WRIPAAPSSPTASTSTIPTRTTCTRHAWRRCGRSTSTAWRGVRTPTSVATASPASRSASSGPRTSARPRSFGSSSGREQSLLEEGEHLAQRVARRLAGLVDEVVGEHRVGVGRVAVGVALRRVDLHADEAVAELVAQPLEALGRHDLVAGEAQADHARAGIDALLH